MNKIILFFEKLLNNRNAVNAIIKICGVLRQLITYRETVRKDKMEKQLKKDEDCRIKEIQDICDNGNIDELIDKVDKLKKLQKIKNSVIIFAFLLFLNGCTTINVHTTKDWEGRYLDVNIAADVLRSVTLDKKESVWLISNETLKRLLTN